MTEKAYAMKLKVKEIDGVTYAETKDGLPVYIHDDGKEAPFDAKAAADTITARNGEAMRHRKEAEAAALALKAFEGITDPDAARKALETVQNLDSKKLIDAGEVEKVKNEVAKVYEGRLQEAATATQKLQDQLFGEKIGGSFARSKLIADKFAIPADIVQARFGSHFKIDEAGRVVATDTNGNAIYSKSKPGEFADFEEALEALVDQYPYKDNILKGDVKGGGGAGQGGGGGNSGARMTQAAFDALTPKERAAAATKPGFEIAG